MLKKFAWLFRFRRDKEEEELARFEKKLIELLRKGEISFPKEEQPEIERCLKTLRGKGVIKSR